VDPKVFHTFSRIHGDMERDYNYFQIDACFFSMGSDKSSCFVWGPPPPVFFF
jgi:hypothetical protein